MTVEIIGNSGRSGKDRVLDVNEEMNNFFERLDEFLDSGEKNANNFYSYKVDRYLTEIKMVQEHLLSEVRECYKRNEITINAKPINECLEDIIKNPEIESVSFDDEDLILTVITKPIKAWKWNLGQYIITYQQDSRGSLPNIQRVQQSTKYNTLIVPYVGSEILIEDGYDHPHIHGMPCFGNTMSLINQFWLDAAKGVNYCLQYLKCYNAAGAFIAFDRFLCLLGYIHDASILIKIDNRRNGYFIYEIYNGKLYNRLGEEITPEMLKELGCNGKLATKKEMKTYIENSRYYKKAIALKSGIKFIPDIHPDFSFILEDEYEYVCENCGEGCNDYYTVEGDIICEYCYSEYTGYCYNCDEYYYNNNLEYYERYDLSLCPDCSSEMMTTCGKCGDRYLNDDVTYDDINDDYYCKNCLEKIKEERGGEKEGSKVTEDKKNPILSVKVVAE